MKKVKRIRQRQRRQIEDVPFYKFKYKFDELPLDPARPFILEQISIDLYQAFQTLCLINKQFVVFQAKSDNQNRMNLTMILNFMLHQVAMEKPALLVFNYQISFSKSTMS